MQIIWNTSIINPENLINISRGDEQRLLKYLKQFAELIPERLVVLQQELEKDNRKSIRQILHKMSPQLQFFGIEDITTPIKRLEFEYASMPIEDLRELVNSIIVKLEGGVNEVNLIIKTNFN